MSLTTLGEAVLAGLANGAFYAFLALSFAAVFALTRALNLAHGELVLLGGYVGYTAGRAWGLPPAALVPLAAVAVVPVGLLWRVLLARVREPVELNSMVLTFGLSLLLQNVLLGVWSADYRLIAAPAAGAGAGAPGPGPARAAAAAVGVVVILLLQLLLTRTRWGTALRATARDAETAALLGVNTDRVSLASFAAAGAIAGAGGVLFATFHYLHPGAGAELTLLAITLAILGGAWGRRSSLPGLLAAGLAVGLLEALTLAWGGPRWRELVVVGLLLAVLLARPRGLERGRAG
ncbi:MAG: branched-chain amino acid ABC transporter permease [Candidatus Rokubacteria bacterium]|nr:branched-chain amino acid ABC transporter permease [Candidatus Rokubacteria bacterium]